MQWDDPDVYYGRLVCENSSNTSRYCNGEFDKLFRAQKLGPDPFCEWAVGWIERHLPHSHGREAPIVWDSGQFHHDGGNFVSLIDLELGHVDIAVDSDPVSVESCGAPT